MNHCDGCGRPLIQLSIEVKGLEGHSVDADILSNKRFSLPTKCNLSWLGPTNNISLIKFKYAISSCWPQWFAFIHFPRPKLPTQPRLPQFYAIWFQWSSWFSMLFPENCRRREIRQAMALHAISGELKTWWIDKEIRRTGWRSHLFLCS